MVTRLTYRNQSKAFLEQAHNELRAGDLLQASEKGWGAAEQMVKAVAASRGWEYEPHRMLLRSVTSLVQEQGDMEIMRLFAASRALHENFYEDYMNANWVTRALSQVAQLVEKLEALLPET